MKAISPEEVIKKQESIVSDLVLKIFNDYITRSWNGTCACVNKDKIREILTNKGYNFEAMLEQGGLKIEPLFEKEGWLVEQDREWWTFSVLKTK